MKKILMTLTVIFACGQLMAQDSTEAKKKDWSKIDLSHRAADHFMIQFGIDNWAGAPDSIKLKGLSRSANVYFMFDFPFKTDPRFSVGIGAGIGTSNIYFDRMIVDLKDVGNKLPFRNVADTNNFKKYKLTTAFLEAPVELRYALNPEDMDKSWKFALGVKVGTMLNAHTKGKTLRSKDGQTINPYTVKESTKRFFNSTRFSGTVRIGYGNLSLFGSYQINPLIKEGYGAEIRPYIIGITLSGL
ncbi:MAG TPA: outer membrane beta-barrel protein [Parasegetibacter sp.]